MQEDRKVEDFVNTAKEVFGRLAQSKGELASFQSSIEEVNEENNKLKALLREVKGNLKNELSPKEKIKNIWILLEMS